MGDDVQTLKAGVMEVADFYVVNKGGSRGGGPGGGGGAGDAKPGVRGRGLGAARCCGRWRRRVRGCAGAAAGRGGVSGVAGGAMKLLLINTCGAEGVVGLAEAGSVLAEEWLPGRGSSEGLVPTIRSLLQRVDWKVGELAGVGGGDWAGIVYRGAGGFERGQGVVRGGRRGDGGDVAAGAGGGWGAGGAARRGGAESIMAGFTSLARRRWRA